VLKESIQMKSMKMTYSKEEEEEEEEEDFFEFTV
jgi:hypothetical protein